MDRRAAGTPEGGADRGSVWRSGQSGTLRLPAQFPAGYKVAAHMHPNDYDVTVLSGTMYLGMGDKFDPARGEGLKVGGYLHLPKGMHHYEWSDEDTVIQLSGVGPVGMTYLNPADDPSKTQ